MNIKINPLLQAHWLSVSQIYWEGIQTGNATFEQQVPSWEKWHGCHLNTCRFVVEHENKVIGWAALSPISERCVYAGVCEVSVYVASSYQGRGIGCHLLNNLIEGSEKENIWTLQAGIFPENIASVTLHKNCGFREVGMREKIGRMNGKWRDVLLLEHRSKIIGI
ncbi:MAG: N-acetyltransferase [Deltaproteobacteria bacterium]|nr:N-acetyltransferase [Deltaproteobacteria bacterium]